MHQQKENSATGTRTRVARVRAEYPNQLDYSGFWQKGQQDYVVIFPCLGQAPCQIMQCRCIRPYGCTIYQIRGRIVVSISARHAEDPGSIPGRGVDSSVWQLARLRACGLQSCTFSELKIPMCRQVPVELSAQQAVPAALATWVSSDTLCTDARAWPRSAQLCTRAACLPAEQHGYPRDSHAGHD